MHMVNTGSILSVENPKKQIWLSLQTQGNKSEQTYITPVSHAKEINTIEQENLMKRESKAEKTLEWQVASSMGKQELRRMTWPVWQQSVTSCCQYQGLLEGTSYLEVGQFSLAWTQVSKN